MSELNTITADLSRGKTYVTASRYMEDYGQVLKIEGIDLPSVYQVDFSNNLLRGTSMTVLGNADGVAIPDEYISTGRDVYAFLYLTGDMWGRTIATIRIPNKTRPTRTDAIPTPTQQGIIDQTIAALNDAVESTAADAEQTASDAARAEAARTAAESAANSAETSATNAAQSEANASISASTATAAATSASASAASAYADAERAEQAASTATTKATEAATAAATAVSAKDDAVSANTAAQSAKTAAQTAQTGAETAAASVEASAEQIATNTSDISDLKEELAVTSLYDITWSQGGINSSGTAVSRTNRIRTDYITIENDSIFVEIPAGFKYAIHAYNASKTRIGYIPNGSDIMTDRKATYKVSDSYANAVYFRMWVAYADDSDILPTEGANVTVAPYESVIDTLKSHVLKSVRILGVGNSYTRDSIRWLCKILKESGYEDVVVGHGYLGASTLAEQYASLDSSDSNHSAFEYWKYSNAKNAVKTSGKTLDEIFTDEPWDIVVFQQQSDESGQYASYVSLSFDINDFIAYIAGKVSNANLKFALMMPWSHADGYTSTKFAEYYNSDPEAMLDAIKTVIPQVADHMSQCDYVVNAGEAVDLGRQNSYLNALGDQMLRTDKNHLYYGIPSYMVGLVYALTLCDVNLNNVMWYPTGTDEGQTGIATSGYLAYLAKQCAFTAVNGYALADDVSDLKAEIGGKADYTDLIKAFPTDTATGAVASFSDGANLPVKSLIVDIDPVQDLHGYDNPWPAGGGKNLFDALTWEQLDRNANFYTVASDETITVIANDGSGISNRLFDISANETYSFLSTFATAIHIFNSSSQTIIQSVSGTFTAPADGKIAIKFYASAYPTSGKFILVKGSTVPTAWSPYSNICPISGRTEVNVEHTGVNIWDEEWEVGDISTSSGQNTDASEKIRSKNYTPIKKGVSYTIVKPSGSGTIYILYYGGNKNYLSFESIGGSAPYGNLTIPTDAEYVRIKFTSTYGTTYHNDICINYPSNDHDYHPYSGQSINIQLGQTVYGGTLDVVSGVLTVDRTMVDLGTLNYRYNVADSLAFNTRVTLTPSPKNNNCICSNYKNLASPTFSNTVNNDKFVAINAKDDGTYYTGNYVKGTLIVKDTAYTDATAFKSAMSGVMLCYELATPLTIQLDPHEVTALLGSNNVWADTGDSTVEYRADPTLYISRLTEPDADMIADANITSGQYFMVGNTLYKATANIASGANIVPNVNCTRKSLSEALNELNA